MYYQYYPGLVYPTVRFWILAGSGDIHVIIMKKNPYE